MTIRDHGTIYEQELSALDNTRVLTNAQFFELKGKLDRYLEGKKEK